MNILTEAQLATLLRNGCSGSEAEWLALLPVVKLFAPDGGFTWLLAAADPVNPDRVWGLRDVADGEPRFTWDSLRRIAELRGLLGRKVKRDDDFAPNADVAAYAAEAARAGVVLA